MDLVPLTKNIVNLLAPAVPFLIETGERVVAAEAIKRVGVKAWEQAQQLWVKLQPKIAEKPALQEAVADLAQNPDDEDLRAALRVQLKKLLSEDPDLLAELTKLTQEAKQIGVSVVASGDRAIAMGGNASGTFITGDNHTI